MEDEPIMMEKTPGEEKVVIDRSSSSPKDRSLILSQNNNSCDHGESSLQQKQTACLIQEALRALPFQPDRISNIKRPVLEIRKVGEDEVDVKVVHGFRAHFVGSSSSGPLQLGEAAPAGRQGDMMHGVGQCGQEVRYPSTVIIEDGSSGEMPILRPAHTEQSSKYISSEQPSERTSVRCLSNRRSEQMIPIIYYPEEQPSEQPSERPVSPQLSAVPSEHIPDDGRARSPALDQLTEALPDPITAIAASPFAAMSDLPFSSGSLDKASLHRMHTAMHQAGQVYGSAAVADNNHPASVPIVEECTSDEEGGEKACSRELADAGLEQPVHREEADRNAEAERKASLSQLDLASFSRIPSIADGTASKALTCVSRQPARTRSEWELDPAKITLGKRIAVGGFAEVFLGTYEGTLIAAKKLFAADTDTISRFIQEVRTLARLRHPSLILWMGYTMHPEPCIITEFMARGTLYQLLRQRRGQPLDPKLVHSVVVAVARGMAYLHSRSPPILHLDLKSPNILIDDKWRVKIADFGLSTMRQHTFVSSGHAGGTPEWMAPEVLRCEKYDEKADVYSYGVVLWELITGDPPWENMNAMQVVGAVGFSHMGLPIPTEGEPFLIRLCAACMSWNPADRPTFQQIVDALQVQYGPPGWLRDQAVQSAPPGFGLKSSCVVEVLPQELPQGLKALPAPEDQGEGAAAGKQAAGEHAAAAGQLPGRVTMNGLQENEMDVSPVVNHQQQEEEEDGNRQQAAGPLQTQQQQHKAEEQQQDMDIGDSHPKVHPSPLITGLSAAACGPGTLGQPGQRQQDDGNRMVLPGRRRDRSLCSYGGDSDVPPPLAARLEDGSRCLSPRAVLLDSEPPAAVDAATQTEPLANPDLAQQLPCEVAGTQTEPLGRQDLAQQLPCGVAGTQTEPAGQPDGTERQLPCGVAAATAGEAGSMLVPYQPFILPGSSDAGPVGVPKSVIEGAPDSTMPASFSHWHQDVQGVHAGGMDILQQQQQAGQQQQGGQQQQRAQQQREQQQPGQQQQGEQQQQQGGTSSSVCQPASFAQWRNVANGLHPQLSQMQQQ